MKDYASKDPRSVAASLRGKGDGRSESWEQFCESVMRNHHTVSDAQAEAMYKAKCGKAVAAEQKADASVNVEQKWVQAVGEFVAGVALAVMIFYCFIHGVSYK